jgi:L-methionine (R)-S-oxide reductase
VDLFPGHIACDSESRSEIVVPIVAPSREESESLVAIIDIDCAVPEGFDEVDKRFLERLAELIGKSCDW